MDIDCQGTPSDFIEIKDGKTEESPLMDKFCGDSTNTIATTQNHVRIRYMVKYSTAVSSEAWAKLRDWASVAGRGRLLLSGSVAHASLKTAVFNKTKLNNKKHN